MMSVTRKVGPEFESEMLEGANSRDGDGGCFNVLSVKCCDTSSRP